MTLWWQGWHLDARDAVPMRARPARIYDGPDEVHMMVVARRVLLSFSQGVPWDVE